MKLDLSTYTNTEFERLALSNRINFSDGHARQDLTSTQLDIISNSKTFIQLIKNSNQEDIERRFLELFFLCANQLAIPSQNLFLSYSSSCAIKMAAQMCRLRNLNVWLIEPCFDSIRHMLVTEYVDVNPIKEDQLADFDFIAANLKENTAIWMVQPNNPTGYCLNESEFKTLFEIARKNNATIIIDFCFRFFAKQLSSWQQYEYLRNINASFVILEDTGKTWSCFDIKAGITACSDDNRALFHRLHDELLLNLSPLQLMILSEFINDTLINGIDNTILPIINLNRIKIRSLVQKGLLELGSVYSDNVPMELLRIPHDMSSITLWENLRLKGIDILPASNYYWTQEDRGDKMFRIPLSRPTDQFDIAIPLLESTLKKVY